MKKKKSKIKNFSESRKTDNTLFDLINKYDELRSIANAIYNSDYFMIATKKEQKEIEAAATCISKALVSAIGLEAINHDFLPDDSGNSDDRSWGDNLPDDSGNGTDTDKDAHDAIKKIMNIAYGETKADGMTKAAARQTLNSLYGATGSHDAVFDEVEFTHTPYKSRHINDRATSIMAMNRKILDELDSKYPMTPADLDHSVYDDGDTDDDSDGDEVKDNSEINLGNFIEGPFYGYQYLDICRQCGFDVTETLRQIEKVASQYHIQMINLVDIVDDRYQIKPDGKYDLTPGSVFFVTNKNDSSKSPVFILIYAQPYTKVRGSDISKFSVEIIPVKEEESTKEEPNKSDDDIEFVGADAYYNISKVHPNSNNDIDLNATLIKIKEKAKEKGIKTITFVDTIKDGYHMLGKYSFELGSLFFVKNSDCSKFSLVNDTNPTTFQYIYPVMTKKDDSEEDSSDSKEDDIKVVKDDETVVTSSDEASPDYVINQYADADTSELDPGIYTKVAFPIFMKPTDTGTDVSFAQICDLYDFDISETVKRIKNAAYLEEIEEVNYIDSFQTFDDIFKTEMAQRWYGYHDGSLFLVRESTKDKLDPCFVILRRAHDNSDFDSLLYRINPIMRPAKIHGIKKIDIIDTYADGDVRIANDSKNIVDIDHSYKIKEICDKRNYDYDRIISCLKGVTAIIGGGTRLTFEGTVSSLNSIILVDPVVAYNTCSVFFVSNFICCEEEAYFVIYMPITGKTKNGYNFRLYRIYPIPNLNQDPNTDSQDDSNVREISQFTSIYRANLEVSEADKDAYMKVEFSLINHIANGVIDSLQNICYTWKFNFYDTIKRIRLVAYMTNLKEIKFAGTACSHEEILEKEVLYSDGSVMFVSDEEDPHFVIVEIINGSTWLNRINPVKE